MTSALEKIDDTTVKLTVTLTEADIAPMMKHAYEHVGSQVQIPGFRKGKVPQRVIDQRIGRGKAMREIGTGELRSRRSLAARHERDRRRAAERGQHEELPGLEAAVGRVRYAPAGIREPQNIVGRDAESRRVDTIDRCRDGRRSEPTNEHRYAATS